MDKYLRIYIIFTNTLQTSPATSQNLVRNTERVSTLLSATLTNDTTEVIIARPNIGNRISIHIFALYNYMYVYAFAVFKAERLNENLDEGYVFPDEDDNLATFTGGSAQVMVPSGLLQDICKKSVFYCACTVAMCVDTLVRYVCSAILDILNLLNLINWERLHFTNNFDTNISENCNIWQVLSSHQNNVTKTIILTQRSFLHSFLSFTILNKNSLTVKKCKANQKQHFE